MRETSCTLLGTVLTWLAIFFGVPVAGFAVPTSALIVAASVGAIITALFVLLGEAIVENIILLVVLLVLAAVLSGTIPGMGFVLLPALLSGVIGTLTNQLNQAITRQRP